MHTSSLIHGEKGGEETKEYLACCRGLAVAGKHFFLFFASLRCVGGGSTWLDAVADSLLRQWSHHRHRRAAGQAQS